MAAVLVERVDQLEEAALQARGLGRGVQGGRARVLTGDRKVTEDNCRIAGAKLSPGGGTMRATEVGVDDPLGTVAAAMIPWTDRRDRGAGQLWRQESASKIRLAPGISSGVGDSCTHSTVPSSPIRTSERLLWPLSSM